jgi:hypothetical protein
VEIRLIRVRPRPILFQLSTIHPTPFMNSPQYKIRFQARFIPERKRAALLTRLFC